MPTTGQARTEQLLQRRQTAEFISSHPIRVGLVRKVTQRDTQTRGGMDTTATQELPEQTFRIAHGPPRRRRLENNPPSTSHAGVTFSKDLLVGRWDADVQVGDQFSVGQVEYQVSYVFQDRDYETICNIETLTQGLVD